MTRPGGWYDQYRRRRHHGREGVPRRRRQRGDIRGGKAGSVPYREYGALCFCGHLHRQSDQGSAGALGSGACGGRVCRAGDRRQFRHRERLHGRRQYALVRGDRGGGLVRTSDLAGVGASCVYRHHRPAAADRTHPGTGGSPHQEARRFPGGCRALRGGDPYDRQRTKREGSEIHAFRRHCRNARRLREGQRHGAPRYEHDAGFPHDGREHFPRTAQRGADGRRPRDL